MCEFMSFFILEDAANVAVDARYLFGDLRSHSRTAELNAVKYGDPDVWREVEWANDGELSVRAKDERTAARLCKLIKRHCPTQAKMLAFASSRLPAGLTTLYLRGATVPKELALPAGLTTLYLRDATVLKELALPKGCKVIR